MAALSSSSLVSQTSANPFGKPASTSSSPSHIPAFSGLRTLGHAKAGSAKTSCANSCKCSRHSTIRAAATFENNSSHETIDVATSSQTLFASVSQASTPPTAPSASSSAIVPAILGAGLLGGAAFALLSNKSAPPTAPAPPTPAAAAAAAVTTGYTNGAATKFVKRAAPAALATMAATFPNAMQEETFMHAVAEELRNLGFQRDNCIALVNTCRDEVCRPIVNLIDKEFGMSFNIAGLGGLVNCGKTGFKAAMSHSPEFPCEIDGKLRERYIFFGFPHVSIGESGEVGSLLRRGRGKPSSACGALIAIKGDIKAGGPVEDDPDNAEYVELKRKIISRVASSGSDGPSLVQVTRAALQAITDDLERLISLTVDPATADYAVITGVQIHSGDQIPGEPFRIERTCDYIAPNAMYAVIRGEKHILHTEINQITAIKSVPADIFSN
ncbi:hypothetical protein CLOM_g534 [Closterium sp. NIES-68]|nr:hypothetical protein CLOM_g534 [Closterium sp. NIES-68]GJP69177.1 hypothetical protein CLOP_g132 [Closterium sp. NIES-67]